jgi:hypothetical protein
MDMQYREIRGHRRIRRSWQHRRLHGLSRDRPTQGSIGSVGLSLAEQLTDVQVCGLVDAVLGVKEDEALIFRLQGDGS